MVVLDIKADINIKGDVKNTDLKEDTIKKGKRVML
jgi:hypothetical protein